MGTGIHASNPRARHKILEFRAVTRRQLLAKKRIERQHSRRIWKGIQRPQASTVFVQRQLDTMLGKLAQARSSKTISIRDFILARIALDTLYREIVGRNIFGRAALSKKQKSRLEKRLMGGGLVTRSEMENDIARWKNRLPYLDSLLRKPLVSGAVVKIDKRTAKKKKR